MKKRGKCQWCGRGGGEIPVTVLSDGAISFEHPVLCGVCAGLIGYGPGGFEAEDRRRQAATKKVEAHLKSLYRGRLRAVP